MICGFWVTRVFVKGSGVGSREWCRADEAISCGASMTFPSQREACALINACARGARGRERPAWFWSLIGSILTPCDK